MSQTTQTRNPLIDWMTVVAIAAIAISLNVAAHEGVHALACLSVGGNLQEYSALYESCDGLATSQAKIVAGSAPTYNLIAGAILWIALRKIIETSSETWYFLWLFMLMNWYYGAGYFIFSGMSNVGDWAVVINGWEPAWFWRLLITIVGALLYIIFTRLALQEFGKYVGGEADEQYRRANKLWILSYITALVVILIAGVFCPYGFLSLPVTAGLFGVAGALSPLLWMVRWFRTERFEKLENEPLKIRRKWHWIVAAIIVVFVYAYVLGQTLYF